MNLHEHVSLTLSVRGIEDSPTLAINERCAALRVGAKEIFNLGLGQSPFPVPGPVVEALKAHAHEKDYLPVRGLRELREAVAEFHRKRDLLEAQGDGVLIGPGSKELMFLLQLVFYGEIIVPTPCWVSYVPQARIIGREVRLIQTRLADHWLLRPEELERTLAGEHDQFRPRLLVLNYPGNPHGRTYGAAELQELAAVARRYEMILLSDEIYGQLHHAGNHVSIGRFYPEGTIVSSGLSKWCGAGGWRLGTFTFPPALTWLMDAMAAVASETYSAVCAPIQFAAVRAFRGDIQIERYLWHARRILAALGGRCARLLREVGVQVEDPEGAFYLFADFSPLADALARRGIRYSATLCERLLEECGVAMLPGEAFGRPDSELTARLAYVNFDGAKALAASETVPLDVPLPEAFLEQQCSGPLRALHRLAEWMPHIPVTTVQMT
jgi:aspartate aminotransferase